MATTAEEKRCKCTIEHGDGFLSVKGEKETLRIDGGEVPGGWTFFNAEETKLFDRLEEYTSGSMVTLTAKEMHIFLKAYNRAKEAWEQAQTDEPVKKVDPPPPPEPEPPPAEPPEPPRPVNGEASTVAERTIKKTAEKSGRLIQRSAQGADHLERQINGLQASVDLAAEGFHMLIYDIPSKLDKECPNPSWLFWGHAFRLNKSCWVFTTKGLKSPAIQDILTHWKRYESEIEGEGVEVHEIPYADRANKKIKTIAENKLDKMVRQVSHSMMQTIIKADEQFKELEAVAKAEGVTWTAHERDRKESYRESRIRAAIKSAGEKLNCAIACAVNFDCTMQVRDALNGLRQAIASADESLRAQVEFRKGV